ncbi:MAG: DUF4290 domain-containing protein [Mucilaginibacter polytrichastri]|nr:DUF4290 domain-containing protein [Mucilaginibacter polytrichastri]
MTFDYNSTRKHLLLAEYGRNVQNMVGYICTLPTKEERNRYAQVVIDLMGFLNPHLRDVADFKHKLWDHLHIISDYKIDVDSPYPKPLPEEQNKRPEPLPYPQSRIRYRHYGKVINKMIDKAKSIDEPYRKQHMVNAIANFMKMAYVNWNKDSVTDDLILSDLRELAGGDLELQEGMVLNKVEAAKPVQQNNPKNKQQQKNRQQGGGGGGGKHNRNRNNQNGKKF